MKDFQRYFNPWLIPIATIVLSNSPFRCSNIRSSKSVASNLIQIDFAKSRNFTVTVSLVPVIFVLSERNCRILKRFQFHAVWNRLVAGWKSIPNICRNHGTVMIAGGTSRVWAIRISTIIPKTAGNFIFVRITEMKTSWVTLLTKPHFYDLTLDSLIRCDRGKPRVSATEGVRTSQASWLTNSIIKEVIQILYKLWSLFQSHSWSKLKSNGRHRDNALACELSFSKKF